MIQLKKNDIVWSGELGGSQGEPFHIRLQILGVTYGGCWCPKEAVEFLRSIGIHVIQDRNYSSGYAACGCWWSQRQLKLAPQVQEAYDDFFRPLSNRTALRLLIHDS